MTFTSLQVHVGEEDFIHLRVYKKLGCHGGGTELSNVQHLKRREDPIVYF